MELLPRRPPGRIDRKAAAYAAEIKRLRAAGYTHEAIREALADLGIAVSECAVRREAQRRTPEQPAPTNRPRGSSSAAMSPTREAPNVNKPIVTLTPVAPAPASPAAHLPGQGIAEDFVRDRITNPLLRKEPSK